MTTTYRDAAIALWGEAGEFAHDEYARHRAAYFGDRVPEQVPIAIGITAYAHVMGLCAGQWEHGPRITLESRRFAEGHRWVSDIIAHEMMHVALFGDGVNWRHKGEPWYAEVRRLSPLVLGRELGIRRGADRKSVRIPNPEHQPGNGEPKTLTRKVPADVGWTHGDVARWPHTFRPHGYDWGKPIPCPSY